MHGAPEGAPSQAGAPGDAHAVQHAVELAMYDSMRYAPSTLTVKRGQTVRLLLRNQGRLMHEIVLGSADEIEQHRQAMRRDPSMTHGAASMAHVAPGGQAQIVWRFAQAGTVHYACLLPGHYEAGMRGRIEVR
ncbi:plastocyanin/azurin family copper-binding protein [Massilia sp. CF038]|uniref:cupredoxin domain-containing protein n=1 Tax=Massilia sp. CF038 TaxID=1881045 RepID=UPI0015B4EC17|nr:cupredoxin family protein [Massilia sp. CF038]